MARPLAPISAWARPLVDDPGVLEGDYIEGEYVDDSASREHAGYLGRALQLQVGACVQICVGFVLVTVGFASLIGIVFVPVGFWLMIRGIFQAKNSLKR